MAKPQIRLKGFEGEWESYLLGEVGFTISGVGFPDKEQGGLSGIPFYKVSDMNIEGNEFVMQSSNNYVTRNQIKKNNWKVCEKPALIFAKVGAAVLLNRKRLVLSPCMCDNNTMLFCFDESKWEPYFCLSLFQKVNLASLAQTGSLPSYNGTMVEGLSVYIPNDFAEQEYCANFFKFLDSLIQSTTKKIASLRQMKSACLVSMFPQAGEMTPRVRFKGFEREWECEPLCNFSKKVIKKNQNLEYKITLTNSAEYGIINQLDFFDHDVSNGDNIRGYYVVDNDDFVYNPRISATAPVGPINRNLLGYAGVMSPLYYVFRVHGIDKDYMSVFFKTTLWHKFMKDNGNSGARFDRLSITDDVFVQMPILYPKDIKEQQRIASYFRNLDKQISLQEKRLEKLKQIKAACLDKMFV